MKNGILNEYRAFKKLTKYAGKYQISFQLWGDNNNNIFIQKDDVDLWSCGNERTPLSAMIRAIGYLDRINGVNQLAVKSYA